MCGKSLATHPDDLSRIAAAAPSKSSSADGAVAVADACNLLWHAVTTKVRLTQVMRQLSDVQAAWRGAPLAAQSRALTAPQVALLPPPCRGSPLCCSHTPVHLQQGGAGTHPQVLGRLRVLLCAAGSAPCRGTTAAKVPLEDAGGLHATLTLALDMPVSVSRNLWTDTGIANGTRDKLLGQLFHLDRPPAGITISVDRVVAAIGQLHGDSGYCGPSLCRSLPRAVSIATLEAGRELPGGAEGIRLQLPLCPDVARTVHRAQGLTLPRAAVHIGDRCTTHGIAFTALSRTRSLQDMLIAPFNVSRHVEAASAARPVALWVLRLARLMCRGTGRRRRVKCSTCAGRVPVLHKVAPWAHHQSSCETTATGVGNLAASVGAHRVCRLDKGDAQRQHTVRTCFTGRHIMLHTQSGTHTGLFDGITVRFVALWSRCLSCIVTPP